MRFVAPLILSLFAAAPAYAGGIGVVLGGGMHTEKAYYYDTQSYSGGGDPVPILDPADYEKLDVTQLLPQTAMGLEIVLGGFDDKVIGTVRGYWMRDAAQKDPALSTERDPEMLVRNIRDVSRDIGVIQIGISWGLVGRPDGLQFALSGRVGSGFLTVDHTEFLTAEAGPTVTWMAARRVQVFADASYAMRYRKGLSNGFAADAGVRYMFD